MDDNKYKSSYSYFENRSCEYYPCHPSEHINCLFCYCPLYRLPKCPGNFSYINAGEERIKNCENCLFPHEAANYAKVIRLLSEHNKMPEE